MRPAQILAILNREFAHAASGEHTPVMLWGPPGVGKSDLVRQAAAKHGGRVIDLRLSQLEPSDLRGIPFRVDNSVQWAVPNMLPDPIRHGPSGVLFLDEINAAPPSVSAAAYQLILDRRLGDYMVPEQWAIVAAGNRQGDRGVSYSMPTPLANRFSHYEVEPNLEDWTDWAFLQGIDERLIAFLRFRPDLLFDFDPAHSSAAFPSPRTWEFAHRALHKFADRTDLLGAALAACVGSAAGVECMAYIENLTNMPDLDGVLAGAEVTVPASIDIQYAVATALVRRLERIPTGQMDACNHALAFARRMPMREIAVMLVVDMVRRIGSDVCSLPQFREWSGEVAELLLDEP